MEKEFIPYDLALALKELGFDEPCFFSYDYWNTNKLDNSYYDYVNYNIREKIVSAPIYQQTFRWFREKYLLSCEITLLGSGWEVNIIEITERLVYFKGGMYKTYEEAEIVCLQKSIELLKNQELKWKKN